MYDICERANAILAELNKCKTVKTVSIDDIYYCPCDFKNDESMPDVKKMVKFGKNDVWGGGIEKHAWFYAKINFEKSEYRRFLKVTSCCGDAWHSPQIILYIDGHIKQGMDVNHPDYLIEEEGEHEIFVYACTGTEVARGKKNVEYLNFGLEINYLNDDVERLFYNLSVPCNALKAIDKNSDEYIELFNTLSTCLNMLDMRNYSSAEFDESVKRANEYIEKTLYTQNFNNAPDVCCIGHTHIDLAWLWRWRQTKEKAQRSFATVIELMKRYPSYKFMSSQVPLYKAVKEQSPELYEAIKEKVREGRWEPEGGMYVEADCNLTGGEGLVRQFLYGKSFFKEEFGVDSRVLWLPDVFGYSAALPQIMQKSGITDFVTSKISWNDTNQMPYDTFLWKGIDGSGILTHFILGQKSENIEKHTTYNSQVSPASIKGTYLRNQQRDVSKHALMTVGYGDGGGGTTCSDIEQLERMKNGIPGLPSAGFVTIKDYLTWSKSRINENLDRLPTWVGELYLEYHRGTYTSQAENKRNNRKSEFELCNVELLASILMSKGENALDKNLHDSMWQEVLFNQFHDILPGSSIPGVYKDSKESYKKVLEYCNRFIYSALKRISGQEEGSDILVMNPTSFAYSGAVMENGNRYYAADVPAKGYKIIPRTKIVSSVKVSSNVLENEYFVVKIDENCNISSIYDKNSRREILKSDREIRFRTYQDLPEKYDAWEISECYTQKTYDDESVLACEVVKQADRAGWKILRKINNSTVCDYIFLYDKEKRIDFENEIDWRDNHVLLKREFPLDIVTDKAACEIQFGHVERPTHSNTSWDKAKFEVCAHKYVDLSENNYGVALINDGKFGHSLRDCNVGITLLRSPKNPDPNCDIGKHYIRYALYPHCCGFANSDVVKQAYFFNNPCMCVKADVREAANENEFSFAAVEDESLVIETIKPAENSRGVVIRLYEPMRKSGIARLKTEFNYKKAYLCDLLENEISQIKPDGESLDLEYKPFEILTVKLV